MKEEVRVYMEYMATEEERRSVMIDGTFVALAHLIVKGLAAVRDTPDGYMLDLTDEGIRELQPHVWAELREWENERGTVEPRSVMIGGMIMVLADLIVEGLVAVRNIPDGYTLDLTDDGIRLLPPHVWAELREWALY